jgi:hypothetical protein
LRAFFLVLAARPGFFFFAASFFPRAEAFAIFDFFVFLLGDMILSRLSPQSITVPFRGDIQTRRWKVRFRAL